MCSIILSIPFYVIHIACPNHLNMIFLTLFLIPSITSSSTVLVFVIMLFLMLFLISSITSSNTANYANSGDNCSLYERGNTSSNTAN